MGATHEIGGYLELERFCGEPYHKGAVALNCGRACLEYLVELHGIRKIWLPDWICGSVYGTCERCGVEAKTYRIGDDMLPAYDFEVGGGEWLYLMDYYGQLRQVDVDEANRRCGGRLVVDEAQGFFRDPWEGTDTLYTCRKFLGVADGAYLHTGDGGRLERELPCSESHGHMGFVLGRYERPAGEFFDDARANNTRFAEEPMSMMSPVTENLLRAVDYRRVLRTREANWGVLHELLGDRNLLSLRFSEGPFMYPFLVHDAMDVHKLLAADGIYIPTLWPEVAGRDGAGDVALHYSRDILPLPCDQRYGAEDMVRVANAVLIARDHYKL